MKSKLGSAERSDTAQLPCSTLKNLKKQLQQALPEVKAKGEGWKGLEKHLGLQVCTTLLPLSPCLPLATTALSPQNRTLLGGWRFSLWSKQMESLGTGDIRHN